MYSAIKRSSRTAFRGPSSSASSSAAVRVQPGIALARPYSRPASETANEAARADPQAATDPNIGRAASDSTTEKRKIPNDAEKNGGAGKEKSGIDHLDKPSGSEEDVHADRLPKQQDPLNEDQKAKKGKM